MNNILIDKMAIHRGFYVTCCLLYLITLAIALWLVLYYSGVPSYVWIFFGIAILIAIICVLMKEWVLEKSITNLGEDITSGDYSFWLIFFVILQLIAFILIIIGIILVIKYSSVPAWVWIILALALIFSIISTVIYAIYPTNIRLGIFFSILAFTFFIIGIIFLIIYSNSPWWVWLIIGIAIFFYIMTIILEPLSIRNEVIIQETHSSTTQCTLNQHLPSQDIPIYVTPSHTTPSYPTPTYSTPSYPTPTYSTPSYSTPSYPTPTYPTPTYITPTYTAPKPETSKCGIPKCETSKCRTPCETPKCGTPKCETPKCGTSKCETPKCGTPKCETPKCETPNVRLQSVALQSVGLQSVGLQSVGLQSVGFQNVKSAKEGHHHYVDRRTSSI